MLVIILTRFTNFVKNSQKYKILKCMRYESLKTLHPYIFLFTKMSEKINRKLNTCTCIKTIEWEFFLFVYYKGYIPCYWMKTAYKKYYF